MKVSLIRIGNSRGIRLPQLVLKQCGFQDELEMEVHNHELVIRSANRTRDGWDEAFSEMAVNDDDQILDQVAETRQAWDQEEWEW